MAIKKTDLKKFVNSKWQSKRIEITEERNKAKEDFMESLMNPFIGDITKATNSWNAYVQDNNDLVDSLDKANLTSWGLSYREKIELGSEYDRIKDRMYIPDGMNLVTKPFDEKLDKTDHAYQSVLGNLLGMTAKEGYVYLVELGWDLTELQTPKKVQLPVVAVDRSAL